MKFIKESKKLYQTLIKIKADNGVKLFNKNWLKQHILIKNEIINFKQPESKKTF
jgi:hypothetical protein